MTYFDCYCFVVGSWMFAIGAVLWSHLRAEPEKTESVGGSEKPERRSDPCESWRSPAVASDSFDGEASPGHVVRADGLATDLPAPAPDTYECGKVPATF
jgi:hypothetical protein